MNDDKLVIDVFHMDGDEYGLTYMGNQYRLNKVVLYDLASKITFPYYVTFKDVPSTIVTETIRTLSISNSGTISMRRPDGSYILINQAKQRTR